MRQGTGTIRRFKGNPDIVVVGIERFGSNDMRLLPCAPEVAEKLLKQLGVKQTDTWASMESY